MTAEILYLAWNRLAFTRFSFAMLLANTDWSLVSQLVVHDDGSEDGTAEWLSQAVRDVPVPVTVTIDALRSPPAVMNRMVAGTESEWFAKIDNDIVVPPGWLENLLGVVERNPELELLGMEAGRNKPPWHNGVPWDGVYRYVPATHIGGVGLMRTSAFLSRPKLTEDGGRFGFTEWQHEYDPPRGFIIPDLLVAELQRVPVEPWVSLSAEYLAQGWERCWPLYHERGGYWWEHWPDDLLAEAVAEIEAERAAEQAVKA